MCARRRTGWPREGRAGARTRASGLALPVPTIEWVGDPGEPRRGRVRLIDQTELPERLVRLECRDTKKLWEAIRMLRVRGAPALGIAGAFGLVLGLRGTRARTGEALLKEAERVASYLGSSRPTAVNLFWALERMLAHLRAHLAEPVDEILRALLGEALAIAREDVEVCREIGRRGAELLGDPAVVLTHCNAGGLATGGYGTALGVLYAAREAGKRLSVYVDETRPLLQGARLTAWELVRAGIPATVICDDMAAVVLREKGVSAVVVGADRIARNGDVANKIGTYGLSVLAKAHGVPFYVAAPVSTFDFSIASGREIPIEERSPDEVTRPFGRRIAPEGASVFNPAFDVTPAANVSAIVTERGVLRPPLAEAIRALQSGS